MEDFVIWIVIITIGVMGICVGFWIGLHNGIHKKQLKWNESVEDYMKVNTEILDKVVEALRREDRKLEG